MLAYFTQSAHLCVHKQTPGQTEQSLNPLCMHACAYGVISIQIKWEYLWCYELCLHVQVDVSGNMKVVQRAKLLLHGYKAGY